MKARDIIPGWPRGKSTTQPGRDFSLDYVWIYTTGWTEGRSSEAHDVMADRGYHAGQQAMVDRWRKLEGEREIDVWLCSAGASELLPNKRQSIEDAIRADMESALYREWRRLTFPELL